MPLTMTTYLLGAVHGFCILRNYLESKSTVVNVRA